MSRCAGSVAALIAASLGIAASGRATAATLQFDHITSEEGLPNNWVQGLHKDRRGFLWIGTQDGLVRYDAGSFVTYRHEKEHPDGLPFPTTRVIFEDSHGTFWLGAQWGGGGLARFDPVTGRFRAYKPDGTHNNPSGAETRAIVEDAQGHLWIGTNHGLNEYDLEHETFTVFVAEDAAEDQRPQATTQNALVIDPSGRMWVASESGLRLFDLAHRRFEPWGRTDNPLARSNVSDLRLEKDGALWVTTFGEGLVRVDLQTFEMTRFRHDPRDERTLSTDQIRCLTGDGNGRLFLGTENGGLNILDMATGLVTRQTPDIDDPRSLNSASIYALYYDDQDILWIGTFNGGLNILSPPAQRFETIRAGRGGLSNPHVASILADHTGRLWVGTDGGGLDRRDPQTRQWKHYAHDAKDPHSLGSNAILSLAEDKSHTLWIGGWEAGLASYDPATDRFDTTKREGLDGLPSRHVFVVLPLSTGQILAGTLFGVARYDPRTHKFDRLHALRDEVAAYESVCFSALEDKDGNLWLGRDGRVDVVLRSGEVRTYKFDAQNASGLGPGRIRSLLADSHGNVWLGSEDGLNVVPAGGTAMRRFTTEDGIPHKIVDAILEDESGSLWISTNNGIAKFVDAVSLPPKPTFLAFASRDGLQGPEFNGGAAFEDEHGEMYFGGARGLNVFLPRRIELDPVPPPVVLTGLKIFNRPVVVGAPGSPLGRALMDTDAITLSYEQLMLTLDYAALNYLLPQKNQYAYQLEGVDREWNRVGTQRSVTYPSLAPGRYTFRVRAWNNDGVVNEKGTALRIVITPPYWQRWWFRLFVLMTLAAGLAAAYRRRVLGMEERRYELERQVELRTADLEQRTADLQNQVLERQEAERKLEQQTAEARDFAIQLATTNSDLLDHRDALEKENRERRRAEELASREKELLHALMDNIPDMIYFKDVRSRLTRVNKAYAALLGVADPTSAEGKTEAEFLSASFAAGSLADEQAIFATGEPLVGKVEHEEQSGRWLLATKVPIRDAGGTIVGLVGISKDISERKQAEQRLAQELASFRDVVDQAAKGDLTRRGEEGQETVGQIARAVNQMLGGFGGILLDMREAAFAVSTSSSEILATATQIARGAEMGSLQVQETSVSVQEMSASMAQVSRSAEMSAENARQVLAHVEAGDRAVEANYQGMTKVNAAAADTAMKMKILEQRSREVFEIIDLIEEIGSQSKLLSLNAAIEAAHAGEAGRGFAVVADEVRRLADKSGEATKQVAYRIDAIIEETKSALAAMQNATREIKAGWTLSEQARNSLAKISALVRGSVDASLQIASASEEQVEATRQVSVAMETISDITSASARGAAETSRAVRDLVDLATQLNEAMRRFTIDGSIEVR